MKLKSFKYFFIAIILAVTTAFWSFTQVGFTPKLKVGQKIDSLNGVYVYYNGSVGNVVGRNTTADGYNLGLKFQCVEFVKRYYYQHLKHKMPDSYGHAKDFYDRTVVDGGKNKKRNLIQFTNTSKSKPQVNDLLVFDGNVFNQYGHVAIISKVTSSQIQIVQQNPGPNAKSRISLDLNYKHGKWTIKHDEILGWLRKV